MFSFYSLGVIILFLFNLAAGAPQSRSPRLFERDGIISRPDGIDELQFHTTQFEFLDQSNYAPIVDAMPVFLYARTSPIYDPCYPESAVNVSDPSKQNPGTRVPTSSNPGQDCKNPQERGSYQGAYTLGDPFPVYVSSTYCPGDLDQWRVDYSLYYVHDGTLSSGHVHDWEGVTVVWKRSKSGQNWWHRDSMIYRVHGRKVVYGWGDLETVDVDTGANTDVRRTDLRYKRHPKVYVGFDSHASFPHKKLGRQTELASTEPDIQDAEYRSDDWWRMPRRGDIHNWDEILPSFSYGSADGTPRKIKGEICSYKATEAGDPPPTSPN